MTNNIFQENNFLWPIITILPTHQISSNLSFAARKIKSIFFQCLSGIYSNLFSKKSWNKVQASNYPTKFVTNKLIHETQTDTESLSLLLTPVQLFTQLVSGLIIICCPRRIILLLVYSTSTFNYRMQSSGNTGPVEQDQPGLRSLVITKLVRKINSAQHNTSHDLNNIRIYRKTITWSNFKFNLFVKRTLACKVRVTCYIWAKGKLCTVNYKGLPSKHIKINLQK